MLAHLKILKPKYAGLYFKLQVLEHVPQWARWSNVDSFYLLSPRQGDSLCPPRLMSELKEHSNMFKYFQIGFQIVKVTPSPKSALHSRWWTICSRIYTLSFFVFFKPFPLGKSSIKKRIFYGQADCKGGGSTPPGLTVSICENFRTFPIEYDSLILKTHFTRRGLKMHI